ncbi:REJ domain-containing protein, partial [Ochromonadaceae sp. CCMP2298]
PSEVSVFLTQSVDIPLLYVGDIVTLVEGVVKAACASIPAEDCLSYAYNEETSIQTLAPLNPPVPVVLVVVPSRVASCVDVEVAPILYNSGGREWVAYNWTVVAVATGAEIDTSVAAVLEYLQKIGPSLSLLPNSLLLLDVSYSLQLSVTNHLNSTGVSETTTFVVDTSPFLPTLTLTGADTTTPNLPLSTLATVAPPACNLTSLRQTTTTPADITLEIYWSLYDTPTQQAVFYTKSSKAPTTNTITAYALAPGEYTVQAVVVASVSGNPDYSGVTNGTASFAIEVQQGSVVATIAGGGARSVGEGEQTLSGAASRDLNIRPSLQTAAGLSYQWSCFYLEVLVPVGAECVTPTGEPLVPTSTSSTLAFVGSDLAPLKTHKFTLQVSAPDGRNASTFTLVTLSEGVATIVTVAEESTYSTYNAAERVSVQGQLTASNALTATWSAEAASSYSSTNLPPGPESLNYTYPVVATAYDSLGAWAQATKNAQVTPPISFNTTLYLEAQIGATGLPDPSKVTAAVNGVARLLRRANCSLTSADACSALNRDPCITVSNTCGSCLEGYQ